MKQRPDTKWKPFLVTNALFVIDTTNYTLGKGETSLPDYIKDKNSIHALVKDDKHSKPFTDKLCAFRCLALHRGQTITNLECNVQHYFQQWNGYQKRRNESTYEAKLFPGLQLQEIPEFESCFQVNINVYELKEDDTDFCVYKSLCRLKETMYLNMYEHHLSYIKDFENIHLKIRRCGKILNEITFNQRSLAVGENNFILVHVFNHIKIRRFGMFANATIFY